MSIFDILSFIGGLSLFIFGMNVMGISLERAAGSRLKAILSKLTSSPIKGLILGAAVTAVIQSSSATTVMAIGIVNSGLMELIQAVGIIIGANLGTTITPWLLSLTGLEGSSIYIQLLKPTSFAPILALIGVLLLLASKRDKRRSIGTSLLGFAVLMFGMETMSEAVKPLAEVEAFTNLFVLFSNPIIGVLVGIFVTAAVQSSSASIGILQALTVTGSVNMASAIPIIMGQNIGTCVTALISSVGTNKNAKRTALVHLYFNLFGTAAAMIIFYSLKMIFGFDLSVQANYFSIAIIHTAFNLFCTVILFPFSKQLARLAVLTVPEGKDKEETLLLDERMLLTPAIAAAQSRNAVCAMAKITNKTVDYACRLAESFDEKTFGKTCELERKTDKFDDAIEGYLARLSACELSDSDSRDVFLLLRSVTEFERLADHARNIAEGAQELNEKKQKFSETGRREMNVLISAVREVTDTAVSAFCENSTEKARSVEPLEEVVDMLTKELRSRHIKRLAKAECGVTSGFIVNDMLTDFERVSDYCSNIALAVLERDEVKLEPHDYSKRLKKGNDEQYNALFRYYNEKYDLNKTDSK